MFSIQIIVSASLAPRGACFLCAVRVLRAAVQVLSVYAYDVVIIAQFAGFGGEA